MHIYNTYYRVGIVEKFHGPLITETNRQKPLLTLTNPLFQKRFTQEILTRGRRNL